MLFAWIVPAAVCLLMHFTAGKPLYIYIYKLSLKRSTLATYFFLSAVKKQIGLVDFVSGCAFSYSNW